MDEFVDLFNEELPLILANTLPLPDTQGLKNEARPPAMARRWRRLPAKSQPEYDSESEERYVGKHPRR